RISASSRTPPKDARINLRFIALAIEVAKEVLPTPGGYIFNFCSGYNRCTWIQQIDICYVIN
ncbi:hypothetical protein NE583_11035, partial [Veillonella parvula]